MQFSDTTVPAPIRVDPNGVPVMPEWSDADPKLTSKAKKTRATEPAPAPPRKRTPRELQPDATQMDNVTQASEWLKAHPEEAAMLRSAQASSTDGDILSGAGIVKRYYSSTEAAAFFDKTVQWLYWGMRHPPHGGRLFVEPVLDDNGVQKLQAVNKTTGEPIDLSNMRPGDEAVLVYEPVVADIPVERLGDPVTGKRRFDIDTIRRFAVSAYHQANIKEPKLRAVLERLVVAEHGGNWKAVPIPKRQEVGDDGPS